MRQTKPNFNQDLKSVYQAGSNYKFAIIVARWNEEYNSAMREGAKNALLEHSIAEENIEIFYAPGAFEIPLLAQKLAETKKYSAVLCFATIIRGETYHFEIVANESARGIMDVALKTGVPVLNGILAVNNEEQAHVRAALDKENKGYEVATSALDLLHALTTSA